MYAVAFCSAKNIFFLLPIFGLMGQLVTLFKGQVSTIFIATLEFMEALIVMVIFIWPCIRNTKNMPLYSNFWLCVHNN